METVDWIHVDLVLAWRLNLHTTGNAPISSGEEKKKKNTPAVYRNCTSVRLSKVGCVGF